MTVGRAGPVFQTVMTAEQQCEVISVWFSLSSVLSRCHLASSV